MQAGETCSAAATSFNIVPFTARNWNRAAPRSGSGSPAGICGCPGFARQPKGEWSREQVRRYPEITIRELTRRANELLAAQPVRARSYRRPAIRT